MPTKEVIKELKEHIPLTALATLLAVIIVAIIYKTNISISKKSFYILHPLHIFVSAIASSAIFYKYQDKFIKALLIGITGAIIIGSLSDIIFPFLGSLILKLETEFHLPLIEMSLVIIGIALLGSITGVVIQKTKIPHSLHVFLSVLASLFYLTTFTTTITTFFFIAAFIIVFIAVIIPCCISDIIYPLLFVRD